MFVPQQRGRYNQCSIPSNWSGHAGRVWSGLLQNTRGSQHPRANWAAAGGFSVNGVTTSLFSWRIALRFYIEEVHADMSSLTSYSIAILHRGGKRRKIVFGIDVLSKHTAQTIWGREPAQSAHLPSTTSCSALVPQQPHPRPHLCS